MDSDVSMDQATSGWMAGIGEMAQLIQQYQTVWADRAEKVRKCRTYSRDDGVL